MIKFRAEKILAYGGVTALSLVTVILMFVFWLLLEFVLLVNGV